MGSFGLPVRRLVPEIMDQPHLDVRRHHHALRSLARINALSLTSTIIWRPLRDYLISRPPHLPPARILDLATGGGDLPIALWHKARRNGIAIELHGCDIHPQALSFAEDNARRNQAQVNFFSHDIIRDGVPDGYDVIVSSLFLHHLDADQTDRFLRGVAASRVQLAIIDDLSRSPFHLALAYATCYTLTRSDVVRFDGPASVRASFTAAEFRALAHRAGMIGATITRHWPFRWRMVWRNPHA